MRPGNLGDLSNTWFGDLGMSRSRRRRRRRRAQGLWAQRQGPWAKRTKQFPQWGPKQFWGKQPAQAAKPVPKVARKLSALTSAQRKAIQAKRAGMTLAARRAQQKRMSTMSPADRLAYLSSLSGWNRF
jgi:hypothetical protein